MQITVYQDEQKLVNKVVAVAEGPEDAKALTDFNQHYTKAKVASAQAAANLAAEQKVSDEAIAKANDNLVAAKKAEQAAQDAQDNLAAAAAAKPKIAKAQADLDAAKAAQDQAAQVQTLAPPIPPPAPFVPAPPVQHV